MATERQFASETAARLLREIMRYQRCLRDIKADASRSYLIEPYRREIQTRQAKLDAMPSYNFV